MKTTTIEIDGIPVKLVCPSSFIDNQSFNGQWLDLPWSERRAQAWKYFPSALALASALGPLRQANDGNPAELGCAFANDTLRVKGWCSCKHDHGASNDECYFHSPDTSAHGWICPQCRGITQVG